MATINAFKMDGLGNDFIIIDRRENSINLSKEKIELGIKKNSLCFTYCQVPIIYSKSSSQKITIDFINGKSVSIQGNELDNESSKSLFDRENIIKQINVSVLK